MIIFKLTRAELPDSYQRYNGWAVGITNNSAEGIRGPKNMPENGDPLTVAIAGFCKLLKLHNVDGAWVLMSSSVAVKNWPEVFGVEVV